MSFRWNAIAARPSLWQRIQGESSSFEKSFFWFCFYWKCWYVLENIFHRATSGFFLLEVSSYGDRLLETWCGTLPKIGQKFENVRRRVPLVVRTTKRQNMCREHFPWEKGQTSYWKLRVGVSFFLGIDRWRQFVNLSNIYLEKARKNYSRLIWRICFFVWKNVSILVKMFSPNWYFRQVTEQ